MRTSVHTERNQLVHTSMSSTRSGECLIPKVEFLPGQVSQHRALICSAVEHPWKEMPVSLLCSLSHSQSSLTAQGQSVVLKVRVPCTGLPWALHWVQRMPEGTQYLSIIPELVSLHNIFVLADTWGCRVMSLLFLASQKQSFSHKIQMKMVFVGYSIKKHVEWWDNKSFLSLRNDCMWSLVLDCPDCLLSNEPLSCLYQIFDYNQGFTHLL